VDVTSEALPLTSVTTPRVVAPSLNTTVPVGLIVSATTGVTVAVSVTACPNTEGFGLELRTVEVAGRT